MSPTERIEKLGNRLALSNRRKRRAELRACLALGNATQIRNRQERLFMESEQWEVAIIALGGNIAAIARHMGYCVSATRRAIWDLGLWPALVKARGKR